MYYRPKTGPRFEHRDKFAKQVNASPSLASKYPEVKSITIDVGHYSREGDSPISTIKFTPNLERARALFRIDCMNQGCVGGDFDLTESLAHAIAGRRAKVSDELRCEGWQNKTTIDTAHCHTQLRFTLNITYQTPGAKTSPVIATQAA